MDHVAFITTEDNDDLIVSFAIPEDDLGDVRSNTLLRTPKYEAFLEESDRGVTVSDDLITDNCFLDTVRITARVVTLKTGSATYELDISEVDPAELQDAETVLRKMNYDGAFQLTSP